MEPKNPIIIDGVNVSGCCNIELTPPPAKCKINDWIYCEGQNCYYKQLKHKEQECDELKKTIMYKCPQCGEEYLSPIGVSLYEENYKLKQTLTKIKEIAEKILVRRQLEDIARHLNKGQEIDWNDDNQIKYCIRFNFPLNTISTYARLHQKLQGTVYCLDKNFKDVAIEEIGEERLKKYLRGK